MTSTTRSRQFLIGLALSFFFISRAYVTAAEAQPLRLESIDWTKHRSVDLQPLDLAANRWTVVCFLGTECPLTRLYGQRLSVLADEFKARKVGFVGVNSNPQDSPADIVKYIQEYEIRFPIIKDGNQSIAEIFKATRTPEVYVLDSSQQIRYRGRIDDQYEPGLVRSEPSKHHLQEALKLLVDDQQVITSVTEPVGCLITRIRPPSDSSNAATVTFAKDVAPILNRRCVECHRPGEIGPFSLTDYDEVVGWGQMMLEVIEQGRMPPWHADPAHGRFVGERRMPSEEQTVLKTWIEQGMPAGELSQLPPHPDWVAGWHLTTLPDVELAMRNRPFSVPKEGTVDYQYFVVDPGWKEDRWIRAAQVIPGDASVVHHAIVFVRPPDGSDTHGIGWLGAYVPGQRTIQLPPGHARRVPAGSRLVFQMHYTPNGRATTDRTRVGVWFIDDKDVTHEVFTRVALNHHFEIPPGANDHRVRMELDGFASESRLLGAMPHMHLRGKSFVLSACRDEQRETLLSVPRYDFNWQHWYQFETPLDLASWDSLSMEVAFDNSSSNPVNPDPAEYVTWGDQTWNEMAVAFFDVSHPRGVPIVPVERDRKVNADVAQAARKQQIERQVDEFLKKMDQDGDGIVFRKETPLTFQRFGFRQMDSDGNDQLNREEIAVAAEQRL